MHNDCTLSRRYWQARTSTRRIPLMHPRSVAAERLPHAPCDAKSRICQAGGIWAALVRDARDQETLAPTSADDTRLATVCHWSCGRTALGPVVSCESEEQYLRCGHERLAVS